MNKKNIKFLAWADAAVLLVSGAFIAYQESLELYGVDALASVGKTVVIAVIFIAALIIQVISQLLLHCPHFK